MRALVLGVGRMGTAIAYAMDKLGFRVTGMDTNPEAAKNIPLKTNYVDGKTSANDFFIVDDPADICTGIDAIGPRPDIVISSLPYHQTEVVGKWCIDNNIRYCDLGGRVDVSKNINDHAKEHATVPVFTDLGLAPGWINILAEEGVRSIRDATDVNMFVGGIPERPMPLDPLRYMETWSFDGLINEYKDECEVIQNGNIISMPGLGGGENGIRIGNGVYEAFYTSGGASHTIHSMKDRGIKNCAYKTLRYAGHRQLVDYLMNYVKLTDDELKRVFDGSKNFYRDVKDKVVMLATVSSTKNSAVSFRKEIVINADDQFSAMQKATAFPISCIASIMAEGLLDPEARKVQKRDHYEVPDAPLTYRDVPYKLFEERLKTLM